MQQTKPKPKRKSSVLIVTVLIVLLSLLLKGCAAPSVPPAPVRLPELPTSAKQPTKPPICAPSCLDALTTLRERSADSLTTPTRQD